MDFKNLPPLLAPAELTALFPGVFLPRPSAAHKGSLGSLGIIGGAQGMAGALLLAARAALHSGVGKVFLSFIDPAAPAFIPAVPELMLRPERDLLTNADKLTAAVLGCGAGTDKKATAVLAAALTTFTCPVVLDADGLNLLAQQRLFHAFTPQRYVLTPHTGEAARLLKTTPAAVEANRQDAARRLGGLYRATIVLKGPGTIVYTPESKEIYINTTGNCALATAGAGDVLAGIIGSLLAQGIPAAPAARAAVYLHGLAADLLVANSVGPIGLTASELAPAVRWLFNYLVYRHS